MLPVFPWLWLIARISPLLGAVLALGGTLALATGPVLPDAGQVAFMANREVQWHLYLLDVQRRLVQQLTPPDSASARFPRWSPDGQWLGYHAGAFGGPHNLYVVEAGRRAPQRLRVSTMYPPSYDQGMITWSPGGTRMVYQSNLGRISYYRLYLSSASGENPQLLLEQPDGHIVHPTWSPDGSQLAFVVVTEPDTWIIYLLDVDGDLSDPAANFRRMRRLTNANYDSFFPAWSPDGSRLAYMRMDNSGRDEIWIINADGSGERNLTRSPNSNDWHPAWLPDGSGIVFVSDRERGSNRYDLYVMDVDGSNVRRLAGMAADIWAPAWRPAR
jgi:TolB protein